MDVSDMVSKATAVNTGRQAGAHSVAEWKKGEKMKQPTVLDTNTHTHTHTHTHTPSPVLATVTTKTFTSV